MKRRFVKLPEDSARGVVAVVLPRLPAKQGVCRVCGCTDDNACPELCGWVDVDGTLCSACCPPPAPPKRARRRRRRA